MISIHSSQTGWDGRLFFRVRRRLYFNPLIPNGMRPKAKESYLSNGVFQSTHPKRDETVTAQVPLSKMYISIHSSQTGWDRVEIAGIELYAISIHSSQTGWDRKKPIEKTALEKISIHSSQTGWDKDTTHVKIELMGISIHSSQTGWDWKAFLLFCLLFVFQSTHPKRDETFIMSVVALAFEDFNPLIPNGMRQWNL